MRLLRERDADEPVIGTCKTKHVRRKTRRCE